MAMKKALAALLPASDVVNKIGAAFGDAGHEIYLVGGSVRDALLGTLGHDLDFTTSALPDDTEKLLRSLTRQTWDTGREFGTISANIAAEGHVWQVEVTTFRADSYRSDSRKPEVAFGENIEEDLIRRDFTVNAMALNVTGGKTDEWRFVDPLAGMEDLADQLLRTPASPQVSFGDDPLRMMRAARFSSQLGFLVEEETRKAMGEMAERIDIISAERVREELSKLLLTDRPRAGLDLLVSSKIADRVLPELPAMKLERDEHMRHKDVYEHSLTVLDQAIELEKSRDLMDGKPNPNHEPDLTLRLAALLHDIGKPVTRAFENGKVTFHHHDVVGARIARKRLRALRYSKETVSDVSKLIALHQRFHGYVEGSSGGATCGWSDSAVRRYVRDAGDQLERLHILTRSDCTTRNRRKADRLRRAYDELEFRIDELAAQEELESIRPELDGNQIMKLLDIAPGPMVGKAYNYLLSLRLDQGPMGDERAEEELKKWWAQQQG
ncbi:CCA tRNA nucleotidyltransferase [Propionimicrobium lymphophilum]|uniref:CCA tRNA nucleotidyltransferase n=1 Tax=Propionimicrobium lymphophilum TaxID=33012 RepID=UPI00040DD458|nr:CCA tRNA nucleotidyltransferase [Propionimicrobium lymphophilum]